MAKKEDFRVIIILWFFIGMASALIFLSLTSCATNHTTAHKIETPKGNFYVNDYIIKNDSIFMIEWNRDVIRRTGHFKLSEVKFVRVSFF